MKITEPILVSACLVGVRCRYSAQLLPQATTDRIKRFLEGRRFLPVCPEQMAGLPTPRPPLEIRCGDGNDVLDGNCEVLDAAGVDRTRQMLEGAAQAGALAATVGATCAILKQGSPSCGPSLISKGGIKVDGMGVTCALLKRRGLTILSEEDIE